jgi:predicted RNA-binding protein Jag
MSKPENHIVVTGTTLSEALQSASTTLGVEMSMVSYEYDREHFKTETGRSKGVYSIQIFAWPLDESSVAGAKSAQAWLKQLTELIGIETNVSYVIGDEKKATIKLNSEKAGRIVGKKGSSLQAITHIFTAAMSEEHSDWTFNIDVSGGERENDRDRGDRRRGRDRDRGRGYDRSDNDRSRDRRPRRTNEDDTRRLERRAAGLASKVLRTGEALEMFDELNSFERRIVHQVVQDIEGVTSKSVEVDGIKKVHLIPEQTTGE